MVGKRFVGKIVKGDDKANRGRYYVHCPELQAHQPESKGILCMNNIDGNHISGSNSGFSGSYTPLKEGMVVNIELSDDDVNSARITSVIGDYK